MSSGIPEAKPLTPTQWLICTIAVIGFAFDIYELLMLPLVIRPALMEMAGVAPGTPEFSMWVGRIFFIPAIAAGVFGMLGGWLTDKFGRRRILTYSILLYAVSAFAAGFSTTPWMLLFFRCTTFIGVSVEFVAAVAWLAEMFPNPTQREKVLGYTQAFSSIGGLMVAFASGLAITYSGSLPTIVLPDFLNFFGGQIADPNAAWRYTLISGLLPAIPLILIRPFLPESPAWQAKKDAGTLKRPSFAALFAPDLRRATIITTLMFACSYGAAFGAIQHVQRMIPGLPQVKERVEGMSVPDKKKTEQMIAANVTKVQEVGGLVGRVLLAVLVVRIVSRRKLLRIFLVPGMVILPVVFIYCAVNNLSLLYPGMFFAGLVVVGQFSFWGNYLPRVFPMHLRGTGEGFAANIGGRMLGCSFAWITSTIVASTSASALPYTTRLAYTGAGVAIFVFVTAFILSFYLPEPSEELPD
ncbi:MFS transporter [bacterium]|jgi:MFS family permease|nr:MFS transporter [bacterium]